MAPLTQLRHDYNIQKRLDDNVYIVRRRSDHVQFLGSRWDGSTVSPAFSGLLDRGAKGALSSLLNHPNLINYTESVADNVLCGRGTGTAVSSQRMLLWDFCDAGTLQNLLSAHPVTARTASPDSQEVVQFLPEGLCWHVLTSVLKSLSWLHEGHRDDVRLVCPSGRREFDDWLSDPDWLPVLHRDIRADNIFFQHPRGIETYGLCKLGNYGSCAVSNHVNDHFVGQVVSATRGDESLDTMRANMASNDMLSIEADKRPYTKATELFQLGRIVYEMMSTKKVPDPEGADAAAFDRQRDIDVLTGYSTNLRDTVRLLLASYRGPCNSNAETTGAMYSRARLAYTQWKSDTPDGKLHRDLVDDGWQRQVNDDERIRADEEMLARQGQRGTHHWTDASLLPQSRIAVPAVPTIPGAGALNDLS
ncbi:hypothetical protein diail_377 [Diaporthe ilicicola]|nr:hypothetical protein diail_377 [Diaporthe ilicicola]